MSGVPTGWGAGMLALGLTVLSMLLPSAAEAAPGGPHHVSWLAGEPTTLSLAADPGGLTYGTAAALAGRLTDPATGSGVAGAEVLLERRDPAGAWLLVAALTTDAGGTATASMVPQATTTFRLRHGDPGGPDASVSPELTVTVRWALAAAVSRTAVRVGGTLQVTGTLAPATGRVRLQLLADGAWRDVAGTAPAADGTFSFPVTPGTAGWWGWRVVRDAGAGRLGVTVRLAAVDAFRLHTYAVTTRGRVRADLVTFRAVVAATYADPRGWLRAHHRFREVAQGGDLTVVLAQAAAMRGFSSACSASYSCRVGRFVVVNESRWRHGSPYFPADLATYRQMVVDHETGHWLGRGHAFCPRPGALAPVMQQQSKGTQGCRPNAWPLPGEIRAVS